VNLIIQIALHMNHLILEFAETPNQENVALDVVEYDSDLNLTVIKGTKTPAVLFDDQATNTFTKANGEGADADKQLSDAVGILLATSTQTRLLNESADTDPRTKLARMLDTSTKTFTNTETSDSDKDMRDISYLAATRTLTESSETLDSDK
jgi:hypothetical protein